MSFKLSACIECMYTEIPFLDRFAAAKNDGFSFVEFWSWTDKDIDAIKAAADNAEIGICGFNGDAEFSLIDPTQKQKYIDFLKKSIKTAQKLGANSVTIHSNALGDGGVVINDYKSLSHTVKLCSMYDTLLECAKIAEQSSIQLNLEALNITTDHVGNFLTTTQMAAEITRLIGSPKLKILFDAYHMQLNEGSLCDNIVKYSDQIGHVHIADAPGRHEPNTGEINYNFVLKTLEQCGYTGYIGCELFPKNSTAQAVQAIFSVL